MKRKTASLLVLCVLLGSLFPGTIVPPASVLTAAAQPFLMRFFSQCASPVVLLSTMIEEENPLAGPAKPAPEKKKESPLSPTSDILAAGDAGLTVKALRLAFKAPQEGGGASPVLLHNMVAGGPGSPGQLPDPPWDGLFIPFSLLLLMVVLSRSDLPSALRPLIPSCATQPGCPGWVFYLPRKRPETLFPAGGGNEYRGTAAGYGDANYA